VIRSAAVPRPGLVLLSMLLAARAARGDALPPQGPIEAREEWLLSMPVLSLPAVHPSGPGRGRTQVRVDVDWGNDFGWKPSASDEGPAPPAGEPTFFMVDGEHRSLGVRLRHGLAERTTLGVRLTVKWRGEGVLDSLIDPFHDAFGFPNAGRPFFPRNQLRVEGDLVGGGRLDWGGDEGAGLGAPELTVEHELGEPEARLRHVAVLRLALPVGLGAFDDTTAAGAVQLASQLRISGRIHAYLGAGFGVQASREVEGVEYARGRAHGFAAGEWRFARKWGLAAQLEAASRLVENLAGHEGLHLYARGALRRELGPWLLEGSFVEGLAALDGTTDFGVSVALQRRY
jgi:hypothetical protein